MTRLYEVTAVQNRYIKTVAGVVQADDGYVAHRSFQVAGSKTEAIEDVISYHMTPGTKYDTIRAEFVREE